MDGRKECDSFVVIYLYYNRFKKTNTSNKSFTCREYSDFADKFMEI